MRMDEILSESFLKSSLTTSLSTTTHHEVGFESTAPLIAQQQLNDVRKAFLASVSLSDTHDLRRRANAADGTLLLMQPDGTPRKAYEPHNIPKPRARKDKEAATYFLARHRLTNMWNGKWTKNSDWEAWDKVKEKMERQFGNCRLIEQPPPLEARQAVGYRRRERKLKRERKNLRTESPSKKRRCENTSTKRQSERPDISFPTPEDVLAATPLEGIRMELLLRKFWEPEAWDTDRFCSMLHEIGTVNKYTKMFIPRKKLDTARSLNSIHDRAHDQEDIPIDPILLKLSSGNTCIKNSKMGAC